MPILEEVQTHFTQITPMFFQNEVRNFSQAAALFSQYERHCTVENWKTSIILKNVSPTFLETLKKLSDDRTIDYYETDKVVIWRINFALLPSKLEAAHKASHSEPSSKRGRDLMESPPSPSPQP